VEDHTNFHHQEQGDQPLPNTFPVKVQFDTNQVIHWDSLIHLYNDWYVQYYRPLLSFSNTTTTMTTGNVDMNNSNDNDLLRDDHDYPRLIVRFEDMLLYAPYVIEKIASCVGTTVSTNFRYQTGEAKSHGTFVVSVGAVLLN
jgi:hypothetical protein